MLILKWYAIHNFYRIYRTPQTALFETFTNWDRLITGRNKIVYPILLEREKERERAPLIHVYDILNNTEHIAWWWTIFVPIWTSYLYPLWIHILMHCLTTPVHWIINSRTNVSCTPTLAKRFYFRWRTITKLINFKYSWIRSWLDNLGSV